MGQLCGGLVGPLKGLSEEREAIFKIGPLEWPPRMHYSQNQAPKHNFPKNIIKVTYLEKHLETIFFHLQYVILFYLFLSL